VRKNFTLLLCNGLKRTKKALNIGKTEMAPDLYYMMIKTSKQGGLIWGREKL
jgi:hypothetical protein